MGRKKRGKWRARRGLSIHDVSVEGEGEGEMWWGKSLEETGRGRKNSLCCIRGDNVMTAKKCVEIRCARRSERVSNARRMISRSSGVERTRVWAVGGSAGVEIPMMGWDIGSAEEKGLRCIVLSGGWKYGGYRCCVACEVSFVGLRWRSAQQRGKVFTWRRA